MGLVKTIKFKKPVYIGDTINAVKIFNESLADELIVLDIDASRENRPLPIDLISDLSNECFMPFSFGGGIKTLEDIEKIIYAGAEKIIINSSSVINPTLIKNASNLIGRQSVIVSIDVKKTLFNRNEVIIKSGTKKTGLNPVDHARNMELMGAGEIFINSIDRDGTQLGYDFKLIKEITKAVSIPVICCGGARSIFDFKDAIFNYGASAVSAGSFFVFQNNRNSVLIQYPTKNQLKTLFYEDKGNTK